MMGSLTSSSDRKSTRLNSSHLGISYAVFCFNKGPGDHRDLHSFPPRCSSDLQVSHVSVKFEPSGRPVALDDGVAHVVLMVAREAVSNAVRHAQPQVVRVSVHFTGGSVRLQVVDDGRGFDSEKAFTAD